MTFNSKGIARPDKEERQFLQHLPAGTFLHKAQEPSIDIPSISSYVSSWPTKPFCKKLVRGHTTQLCTDPFYKMMWQSHMRTVSVLINIKVSNFALYLIVSWVYECMSFPSESYDYP